MPPPSDPNPPQNNNGVAEPAAKYALRFRRPGVSLAAFPGFLYALLPYPLQTRLAQGGMVRQVLGLAWPSVLEQSLITLVGLVDAYIVGHLGKEAIAGVGLGGQVLNLAAALFAAVGVGGTALIARAIGARDQTEANHLARQALALALGLGVLVASIGFFFARPIVQVFGATPEVVVEAESWLRTVAPSFVFLGVLLVGAAALRGAGNTRATLEVMVIVNIVNVVVALAFTRGWLGLPMLGVVGTGLGAMSGHIVGGVMIYAMLARGPRDPARSGLRLGWGWVRPNFDYLRRILNIGLPAGAEQVLLQFAQLSLALFLTNLGTAAYAAHQIGIRIAALSFLPGWGFSIATVTLVGQELGAQQPDRARKATYVAFACALGIMTSLGLLLVLVAEPILQLFTIDADVIREGLIVVRTDGLIQPLVAASFVFSGALRGAGDTRTTMVITVLSVWAIRLSTSYFLAFVLGLGLQGIWLAIGIDFAVRGLFFFLRFRSGRWAALKV